MRVSIETLGVGAMVVATAWALLTQGPVVERTPYPLPATLAAAEERKDAQPKTVVASEERRDAQPKTVVAPKGKMEEQAKTEQEWSDGLPHLSTAPELPASSLPAGEVGLPATERSIRLVRTDSRH